MTTIDTFKQGLRKHFRISDAPQYINKLNEKVLGKITLDTTSFDIFLSEKCGMDEGESTIDFVRKTFGDAAAEFVEEVSKVPESCLSEFTDSVYSEMSSVGTHN
jgi:hypothetical protein